MTVQRILVPVDFSECSGAALDNAVALSRALGAELEVIHSFDVPNYLPLHVRLMMGEVEAPLQEFIEEQAKERLEEFLQAHGAKGVRHSVERGDIADLILEHATNADLIVMGTHGRQGVERWLMGSTAQKVLRDAPCPVLMVKNSPLQE